MDELADEILKADARRQHKSMRQLGIIDERRARTIREKEITLSYLQKKRGRDD